MPTDEHADEPTSDQARPIPPRYWWLKRILLAAGVLILALAALRWWWGWEAERRLEAKIAEYRAAGQPVTIEDFQRPPVPDKENAAYLLRQAWEALAAPADCSVDLRSLDYDPEWVEEHPEEIGRLVEANEEVFRLVRLARCKRHTDWDVQFASPVINTLLPELSPQKRLARFLCNAALYEHRRGNDAEALEIVRDVLNLGDRVSEMGGFLISHVVTLAVCGLGTDALEEITPGLAVERTDQPTTVQSQWASRQQVSELIQYLLDDGSYRRYWRTAMYMERLEWMDGIELAATGRGAPLGAGTPGTASAISFLFGPPLHLDAVRLAELITPAAEARERPNWSSAAKSVPASPDAPRGIARIARLWSCQYWPSWERALCQSYLALALRRMAATALAIRLYELDHGRRPESLGELVPEYLRHVPADPFGEDGRPLGYRPEAAQPVLYSVGPNGVDESGEYALTEGGAVQQEQKDMPWFLNGDRPRAKRTEDWVAEDVFLKQTVDDDEHVDDDVLETGEEQGAHDHP